MLAPVHFSTLKLMARSPAHYHDALLHRTEPTAAMRLGTAVHAMVLGEWKPLAVWTGGTRRGKEWEIFKAVNAGCEIITLDEHATATAIADAITRDPLAAELFMRCTIRESVVDWTIGDRQCCGRPDAFGPDVLVELKTTSDANPAKFPWQASRLGYHAQMAWYLDALGRDGYERTPYIVAVETKPPFVVQSFELTPDAIDFGRRCYRLWLERLLVCEASESWPGYSQCIEPLAGPPEAGDLSLTIGGEEVEL